MHVWVYFKQNHKYYQNLYSFDCPQVYLYIVHMHMWRNSQST